MGFLVCFLVNHRKDILYMWASTKASLLQSTLPRDLPEWWNLVQICSCWKKEHYHSFFWFLTLPTVFLSRVRSARYCIMWDALDIYSYLTINKTLYSRQRYFSFALRHHSFIMLTAQVVVIGTVTLKTEYFRLRRLCSV